MKHKDACLNNYVILSKVPHTNSSVCISIFLVVLFAVVNTGLTYEQVQFLTYIHRHMRMHAQRSAAFSWQRQASAVDGRSFTSLSCTTNLSETTLGYSVY